MSRRYRSHYQKPLKNFEDMHHQYHQRRRCRHQNQIHRPYRRYRSRHLKLYWDHWEKDHRSHSIPSPSASPVITISRENFGVEEPV